MSDMHNHILCGMDSQALLKNEELKKIISDHPFLYRLGCMGGDIFYYYRAMSAQSDPWVKSIGDMFHARVNEIFNNAKIFIKSVSKPEAEKAVVYMMGFINHHALDAETHPLINYFGGCKIKGREDTNRYEFTHKRFEVLLDLRYAKYRGQPMCNVLDFTNLPHEDIDLINRLYQFLLKSMKKEIIPDHLLASCLKDYKKLMQISLHHAYLYPVMALADKISGKKYRFTRPFFIESANEKQLDIMNLQHKTWVNPCNENEKMQFSYPELFAYAVKKSAARMKKYHDFLMDKGNDKKADTIFQNIDFATGSSVYRQEDIKFIHCIL